MASRPFNVDATVDIPLDTVNVSEHSHFRFSGMNLMCELV